MAENVITGNAASIDGLSLGNTTPNRSTRRGFATLAAVANSAVDIQNNLQALPDANGGQVSVSSIDASGTFTANASTVTGVTDASGFNGASAIIGRTTAGILNSPIDVGQNVVQSNGTSLGDLAASASTTATSTASATTATSAASVVDVASVGLQNSRVNVGGSANTLKFTGAATGNATATGVTVGSVSAQGQENNANPNGIDGPNSILNLNVRGLSPQTSYYQDPISPFFADFGGLTSNPTFGSGLSRIGSLDASSNPVLVDASGAVGVDASGSTGLTAPSPTTVNTFLGNVAADGQLFISNATSVLNLGQLLFDASGAPINSATGDADGNGFLDSGTFEGLTGNTITGDNSTIQVSLAAAGQLFDVSGNVLFTDASGTAGPISGFTAASIPVAVTDGSGNSISIGGNGNVLAEADALGSSTAKNTTGDTNAFGSVFSTGATLIGNVNIGDEGNVTGTSRVGFKSGSEGALSGNTVILTDQISTSSTTTTGSSSAVNNTLSIGLGTSAVRQATPLSGNVASTTPVITGTPGAANIVPQQIPLAGPAQITIGTDGNVNGTARNVASATSKTTTGTSVAYTGGLTTNGENTFAFNPLSAVSVPGTDVTTAQLLGAPDQGNALTVGIFNVDITGGGSHNTGSTATNDILGDAVSAFTTSSSSTSGNANAGSSTITAGIFGADLSSGRLANTDITLGRNGSVVGSVAQSVNNTTSSTITGNSTAANASTTTGIGNVNVNVGQDGSVNSIASAMNTVKASTVTGTATAISVANTIAIDNTPIVIGGNGSISATASMISSVG